MFRAFATTRLDTCKDELWSAACNQTITETNTRCDRSCVIKSAGRASTAFVGGCTVSDATRANIVAQVLTLTLLEWDRAVRGGDAISCRGKAAGS